MSSFRDYQCAIMSRVARCFLGRCNLLGDFFTMKKYALALAVAGVSALAMAEGSSGFDPSTLMTSANTTITSIVTALGTLLATAAGIYLAFVGWRAFKAACNKV